jgi:Thioesterase-like superfamily
MGSSTLFTDAMALTPTGDGCYDAELNEHWTIGPPDTGSKVHGGVMLALCANAARTELGGGVQPIAVSGNFVWAPDPGPMRVITTVRKRGRRISLIDVELCQAGRTAVRAAVTLGEPEHHVPPLLSVNPVIPLMQPEPPPGLEPIGPGHPMAEIVHLAHGCDIRPSLTTMEPRSDDGPARAPAIEYWVRPKGVAPDVLFAIMCADVSAPVTFAVNRRGWAPTVQLTAYLRALPTDGWLRVLCTTLQIGQAWFDEDHIVVDCEGRIIVQSRQLAMVPPDA